MACNRPQSIYHPSSFTLFHPMAQCSSKKDKLIFALLRLLEACSRQGPGVMCGEIHSAWLSLRSEATMFQQRSARAPLPLFPARVLNTFLLHICIYIFWHEFSHVLLFKFLTEKDVYYVSLCHFYSWLLLLTKQAIIPCW